MKKGWSFFLRLLLILTILVPTSTRAVSPGQLSPQDIAALSIEDLGKISVITPSKRAELANISPSTVYVITEEDIERYGYFSLKDILMNVPGIEAIDTDFFLFGGQRGFLGNFSQTLLLVNGREMQNLIAGEAFISDQFSTHRIKRVEIVQGPGSVLYGANAFTGVINVITKIENQKFEKTEVYADIGTQDTRALSIILGERFGDLRVSGSLRFFQSDGWNFSDFVADPKRFSEGQPSIARGTAANAARYKNRHLSVPLSYRLDYKDYYFGGEYYYLQNGHGLESVSLDYASQRDTRSYSLMYVGFNRKIGEKILINLEYEHYNERIWGTNFNFSPEKFQKCIDAGDCSASDAEISQENIFRYFTEVYSQELSSGSKRDRLLLQLNGTVSPKFHWVGGYIFDRLDILSVSLADGINSPHSFTPEINESRDSANFVRKPNYLTRKHSVYLQTQNSFLDQLMHLTLGIRYDYQNYYHSIFTMRSGFVITPGQGYTFRANWAEAFREPTIFDVGGGTTPNLNLRPARIDTFELGINKTFDTKFQANLVAYHSRARDFITPVGTTSFVNSPGLRTVSGLEAQGLLRMGSTHGDIMYAFTQTSQENFANASYSSLGVHPHRLSLGLSYDISKSFLIGSRTNFFSGVNAKHGNPTLDEVIFIDPAWKVDITLRFQELLAFGRRTSIQATVFNIFNAQYTQPNVRRGGPKQFLQKGTEFLLTGGIEF